MAEVGFDTFVINLDRSANRMAQFENAFKQSKVTTYKRASAFSGGTLPELVALRLIGDNFKFDGKGTLGSFISHVSILERIVNYSLINTLVLEDDVIPTELLSDNFQDYNIPINYDICFVNDRMVRGDAANFPVTRQVITCFEAVSLFERTHNAPGADGYFVSLNGAKTLLQWLSVDGLGSFFDWRLLAYSLRETEIAALPSPSTARSVLEIINRNIPHREPLISYVLTPPLIKNIGTASDIWAENEK